MAYYIPSQASQGLLEFVHLLSDQGASIDPAEPEALPSDILAEFLSAHSDATEAIFGFAEFLARPETSLHSSKTEHALIRYLSKDPPRNYPPGTFADVEAASFKYFDFELQIERIAKWEYEALDASRPNQDPDLSYLPPLAPGVAALFERAVAFESRSELSFAPEFHQTSFLPHQPSEENPVAQPERRLETSGYSHGSKAGRSHFNDLAVHGGILPGHTLRVPCHKLSQGRKVGPKRIATLIYTGRNIKEKKTKWRLQLHGNRQVGRFSVIGPKDIDRELRALAIEGPPVNVWSSVVHVFNGQEDLGTVMEVKDRVLPEPKSRR